MKDYRNTNYCKPFENLKEKKEKIVEKIKRKHPKATNFYNHIKKNNCEYKDDFMEIYNNKCSYCGISKDLIFRKEHFQIDHYIAQTKCSSSEEANEIKNLVLACDICNKKKSDFDISSVYDDLYPDSEEIKKTFLRDNLYYIQISEEKKNNSVIKKFYDQLELGGEIKRLDYFLMNLIRFKNQLHGIEYELIGRIIDILKNKRNY